MKKLVLLFLLLSLATVGYSAGEKRERIDLNEKTKTNLIIPSPVEMIVWGKALDVEAQVSVGIDVLTYRYSSKRKEQGAIYLGRTMAIVLVGMGKMNDRTVGRFFVKIKDGLEALGIEESLIDQFEGMRVQFESHAISRQEMVRQLDLAYAQIATQISGDSKQDLVFRILQGSSWVQAQNLLARSMKRQHKYKYAKLILDQPDVVDAIIDTLQQAKREGNPSRVINPLIKSMQKYRQATSPPELYEKQVNVVIKETDKFLLKY